jgi:hypothetical protein
LTARSPLLRAEQKSRAGAICNPDNIEFVMKRLREPVDVDNHGG